MEYEKGEIPSMLLMRLTAFIGLLLCWYAAGDMISAWVVIEGIEWVSVSSATTFVMGIGLMFSSAIFDKVLNRFFDAIKAKKSVPPTD